MSNRQTEHPHFCDGGFSVQLRGNNPFGRILVDQTTKVKINKDTKTAGGTTRFSQQSRAVNKCYLTAEHRSGFLGHLRMMPHINQSMLHHSELQKPRMEKDERTVAAITDVLKNWIDPFEENR